MKKIIVFILLLTGSSSYACDICGCNNGGTFFGILPQSHRQFAGLRYRYTSFDSHLSSKVLATAETFKTTEIWTRLYPVKNLQVLAFLPYHQNVQSRPSDEFSASLEGIGDATVLAHYNLLNTFGDTVKIRKVNHSLLVGAGVKAPLGKYQYDPYDLSQVANANFQIGSGSWDMPLNAIYTLTRKGAGLNINVLYKVNGTNSNNYKFANQLKISLLAFKSIYLGNTNLMTSLGVSGDYKRPDLKEGERNLFTGGYTVMASGGIDYYVGKLALSLNAQLPIIQDLSGGELRVNETLGFGISRMF